jgi:C1A family cysteine protease
MANDSPPSLDLAQLQTALNESGYPWQAATNPMTALSEAERVNRLGVPLPPDSEIQAVLQRGPALAAASATAAGGITAPASFDARNVNGSNYVTPVKDQGNCGSCVAFGVVGAMETTAALTRGQPGLGLDLSEAHLFYTHGGAVGVNCNTGWLPEPALDACHNIGITFEDYFPYTPGNSGGYTLNADWPNRLARVSSWASLTSNAAAMKAYISTKGAITACFFVYQDFFSYRSGVYRHVTGGLAGGHCLTLIGYDDAQGCWIAKNSWGPGWGDSGFVRIAYGECGIDSWHVCGVDGVSLRRWLSTHVIGLWANDVAANSWAYLDTVGWLKLAPLTEQTSLTMLTDFTAAKGYNRPVSAFEDNGLITTSYVF